MAVPGFDELHSRLEVFAARAPGLLRGLSITQEFAPEIERTLAIAEAPFTLAIVGQMRVGKSTLINALIGADLAIAGVTETTATVNWFRYGSEEQARQFRVAWNDAAETSELRDLSEREQWSGNSELAARTRFIEFYSTAEFLKTVHIVDTPGTRSTIGSHEQAAREFLLAEGRSERDSQFYGGMADCIVYALPPVSHQNDGELLTQFTSQRRFSQSTPFNSVAVLHKWETIEHERPWEAARDKASRAFSTFKNHVCDVIPVSGPLALAAHRCADVFWNEVNRLVSGSSAEVLETLTMQESWFTREEPDCRLSIAERSWMKETSGLPWPCFKTLLLYAASRGSSDARSLRDAVRQLSGIDRLQSFLEQRFFARARLIRASNMLNRALHVTDAARAALRGGMAKVLRELETGRRALDDLGSVSSADAARNFIERRLLECRRDDEQMHGVLNELEREAKLVHDHFRAFADDCRSVQTLDEHAALFENNETQEILSLLGAYGSAPNPDDGTDPTVEALHERFDHWLAQRYRARGQRRYVLEHVVNRLETRLRKILRQASRQ